MTLSPLQAAAYAGKLAGIACEALLELLSPSEHPAAVDDFDEDAAARYLEESALDCGLGHHIDYVAIDEPYLPAPADVEARTAPRPTAGDAPRVDPAPPVGDAGRLSIDVAATAAFGLQEWAAGRRCMHPPHWDYFINALHAYTQK